MGVLKARDDTRRPRWRPTGRRSEPFAHPCLGLGTLSVREELHVDRSCPGRSFHELGVLDECRGSVPSESLAEYVEQADLLLTRDGTLEDWP